VFSLGSDPRIYLENHGIGKVSEEKVSEELVVVKEV
jgi:hypothetical protein